MNRRYLSQILDSFSLALILALMVAAPCAASLCGKETLYGVVLNGETVSEGTLFLETDGGFLVPADEAAGWRLKVTGGGIVCDGKRYVTLDQPGMTWKVDTATQAIVITAPSSAFQKTLVAAGLADVPLPQPGSGLLFNYDLMIDDSTRTPFAVGALAEAALFRPEGVFDTTFVGRKSDGGEGRMTRLETFWFRDDAPRMMTYRIGDSATRPGLTGGWTRFAGIQVNSNFSLRPGFSLNPLPSVIGGTADTPSVIDVLVNNARVASSRVPSGPFDVPNIPAVSGAGEVSVVVRDLLGRERVIVQGYYLSPAVLRKGLSDFSYQGGVQRRGYGFRSNDYKDPIFSGLHRYGFTDDVTGEAHIEAVSHRSTLETGGSLLVGNLGVATFAVAGSVTRGRTGGEFLAGYEYHDRRFSIGGSYLKGSPRFRDFGSLEEDPVEAERFVAATGISLDKLGNLTFSYTGRRRFEEERVELVTAGYGISIGGGTLSLLYFRDIANPHVYSVTASFMIVFDQRRTLVQDLRKMSADFQGGMEFQQSLPSTGTGYAGRLRAESRDNDGYVRGEVLRRGEAGETDLWYSYDSGDHYFRADATGSLIFMNGIVKPSRRISQSFVLAEVPGFADVTVYANNHEVGKTDSGGYLIIPDTRPYEANSVTFNAEDLPITTRVEAAREVAVPAYLSGTHLKFQVAHEAGLVGRFVTVEGKPLPPGTMLRDRSGHRWPIARDGVAYLYGLQPGSLEVDAETEGRTCRAAVVVPAVVNDIPDIGTVVCR